MATKTKEFDIDRWRAEHNKAKASLPRMLRHSSLCTEAAHYAPELLPIAATLVPFEGVFGSMGAGPQPQARGYSSKEKPYIEFQIDDPRYPGGDTEGQSIHCRVTADKVVITWYCMNGANGENYREDTEMTLSGLWNYLRQIPRPYHCF